MEAVAELTTPSRLYQIGPIERPPHLSSEDTMVLKTRQAFRERDELQGVYGTATTYAALGEEAYRMALAANADAPMHAPPGHSAPSATTRELGMSVNSSFVGIASVPSIGRHAMLALPAAPESEATPQAVQPEASADEVGPQLRPDDRSPLEKRIRAAVASGVLLLTPILYIVADCIAVRR